MGPNLPRSAQRPMDVLIAEIVEPEVLAWLGSRHSVHAESDLVRDPIAFRRTLAQARTVIMPTSLAIDASAVRQATHLRGIGRLTPSVEGIDLAACASAGIEVVRPASAGVAAEAEFAVGALLQMLRRVPVISPEGLLVGRELSNCMVGIIGMTPAAKPLADLLRAFGARVVGYDPGLHASDPLWARWNVSPIGLRELVEQSDSVCVLLNYFSRYRGLLGERYLAQCKPDQVMVNLSSALILDEAALAEVLRSGRMAACWLDHVEAGATGPGRPLENIDSLQITPRVAAATRESHLRASWAVARRLDEILSQANARDSVRGGLPAAPAGSTAGPTPD